MAAPLRCSCFLNGQQTSTLTCSGFGPVAAFSGFNLGRDNPRYVAKVDIGPIPPGTYYIIDRQSGGMMGWLHDPWNAHGWGRRTARGGSPS